MSSFYAYDFIFDGIPSQKFGLKIITFEDGGLFNGVGSSDVEIISQQVLRKSKPYYLGRTQSTVLEFPLTFGTAYPISGFERDLISKWLFGRAGYKKLYILQDDLNGAHFKCFLTKPQPIYVGGLNYAFTCNVTCDSPWAYSIEHSVSGSVVGLDDNSNLPDASVEIYNGSSEDDYLYPNMSIYFESTLWGNPNYPYKAFIIQNMSDIVNEARYVPPFDPGDGQQWFGGGGYSQGEPRQFIVKDIPYTGDIDVKYIIVNNDLQIIEGVSDTGYRIRGVLEYFNKLWFRLVPGLNRLEFFVASPGDVVKYRIAWEERMKIGG